MSVSNILMRKEEELPNLFAEGSYLRDRRTLYYLLTNIPFPEGVAVIVTVIDDKVHRYQLYGRTEDFQTIQRVDGEVGDLEVKIEFLSLGEGLTERPRLICMRDGRIFVNEDVAKDKHYLGVIPSVVETAGEMFREKQSC